jgi:hypothetical protein
VHAEPHFGTPSHYQSFAKSFVFKNIVAKEGLPKHNPSGLGAGGPRFKSGRPDQIFKILTRMCQLLCPLNRQMGTLAHSQPHATITVKLFCFSRNTQNRTVVFGSPPAWAHDSRPQQLQGVLLTINNSNKSGNLLFAQSQPQICEGVGFWHSFGRVEVLLIHERLWWLPKAFSRGRR